MGLGMGGGLGWEGGGPMSRAETTTKETQKSGDLLHRIEKIRRFLAGV